MLGRWIQEMRIRRMAKAIEKIVLASDSRVIEFTGDHTRSPEWDDIKSRLRKKGIDIQYHAVLGCDAIVSGKSTS